MWVGGRRGWLPSVAPKGRIPPTDCPPNGGSMPASEYPPCGCKPLARQLGARPRLFDCIMRRIACKGGPPCRLINGVRCDSYIRPSGPYALAIALVVLAYAGCRQHHCRHRLLRPNAGLSAACPSALVIGGAIAPMVFWAFRKVVQHCRRFAQRMRRARGVGVGERGRAPPPHCPNACYQPCVSLAATAAEALDTLTSLRLHLFASTCSVMGGWSRLLV